MSLRKSLESSYPKKPNQCRACIHISNLSNHCKGGGRVAVSARKQAVIRIVIEILKGNPQMVKTSDVIKAG